MGTEELTRESRAESSAAGELLLVAGYQTATFLASGVEGSVHALDAGTVAKVWTTRTREQLHRIKTFYDALAATGLPFETPRVFDIVDLNGAHATIEKRLVGRPLHSDRPGISPILTPSDVDTIVFVLRALATARPTPALYDLPPLDEDSSTWTPESTFTSGLIVLIEKRTARFAPLLRRALGDFDSIRDHTIAALRSIPPSTSGVVHGDLIPANILIGNDGEVTAVLDFGFLSTVGDPAFDAAVTPAITDMYGHRAADTQAQLDLAIEFETNLDPRTLEIYRAAYALVTSNAFDEDGNDGHFQWCMNLLQRTAIQKAIS
jgi:hypothetical protein